MISKSLGSSFTTRIGPPIQIQKPKVTKVETLMRHEKAVLFSSFIHSFIHSLTRYLGSTHHVLSTWDTPENEIIHYTIYWKVWVLFIRSKVGGGAGSWGVVWCCAILNRVVSMSLVEKKYLSKDLKEVKGWCLSHPSSVQFSRSVMSDSLWPHESQHARPPCPSPTPRIYSNSCPSSWWCHSTILSSVIPFSSCPQSLPASVDSFQMSQLFPWGGQSIGVSASTSDLPMNTQDWSPLGWTGWISLQSRGLSRVFSNTTVQKHQFFGIQFSSQSNSHIHTWPLEKP